MRPPAPRSLVRRAPLGALVLLAAATALAADRPAPPAGDALARELAHWTAFVAADTARDENSVQIVASVRPALQTAADALARGRRAYALLRLAAARTPLAALRYTREHAEAARTQADFDREWARVRGTLGARLDPPGPGALAGVRPVAVRAMAEAALPQVRVYLDASPDYARSTAPEYGLFYAGEAVAQSGFVDLARALGEPAAGPEPAFRALTGELDTLQSRMLAIYRPPVSIDRHPEFIGASAALKEARELDAAGLRRGALLRYLQAVLRFQPLREHPPAFDPGRTPARLREHAARLTRDGLDHGLGRLFLEVADADLDDTSRTATHATAAAVAEEVLPAYLAALGPAPVAATRPTPRVTVTLVRWPYT